MPAKLMITDFKIESISEDRIKATLNAKNKGDTGEIWAGIYNLNTGGSIFYEQFVMAAGGTLSGVGKETVTKDTKYKASTGHVTDGKLIEDDSRTVKVVVIECKEGDKEVLATCSDGSVKRWRECENGKWVEKSRECPPEPECDEGDRETLETCWDGSIKKERVCKNGQWVTKNYDCPPQPECEEGDSEILEYCPDGYTVKRKRVCENGEWVEKTYDCPPAPPTPPEEETFIDIIIQRIQEFMSKWGL